MARNAKYLAVGEEVTAGTEVAAADYLDVLNWRPIQSKEWGIQETVGASYIPDAEIMTELGGIEAEWYLNCADAVGWFLKWQMGDPTSASTGGATSYNHTYKFDDALKTHTALAGSKDLTEEPYAMQHMQRLEFGSAAGAYVIGKHRSFGTKKEADNTIGSPSFSTLGKLRHSQLTLNVDTVDKSQYVGSASVVMNNNIPEDEFTAGSTELQNQALPTRRRVDFTVELAKYDAALRTAFNAGSTVDLDLTWTGALIEDSYYYKTQLYASKVCIAPYSHDVDGRNTEKHRFEGFAIYDSSDASELVAVLTNLDSDYPDAS